MVLCLYIRDCFYQCSDYSRPDGFCLSSVSVQFFRISFFDFCRLRYVKKREIQSEDDLEDVKVIPDESPPIEPIITVSEVVSSIKESLEHLGNTLLSSRDRLVEKDIVHF